MKKIIVRIIPTKVNVFVYQGQNKNFVFVFLMFEYMQIILRINN